MRDNICIATSCQDGICYKNAYWKDRKTLAVRVKERLKHKFSYDLSLGYPGKCELSSATGVALPITNWQFTTQ
jgi:hypothetical protein